MAGPQLQLHRLNAQALHLRTTCKKPPGFPPDKNWGPSSAKTLTDRLASTSWGDTSSLSNDNKPLYQRSVTTMQLTPTPTFPHGIPPWRLARDLIGDLGEMAHHLLDDDAFSPNRVSSALA
ncbi:related to Surfeit locus protein 1 [Sporisorium scitamineum]|uniref:Related to Surfeit locus protein 1 n=1 Tax=Sporisorium scitamineum TaxID=49012 RepID=A0A0F7S0I5_9BASI|nr:related to Surfeit locus protein 1 [Sporisorium scitamineum]CDW95388.1 hypothetical protein [Sporisorium scitamineum]